MARASVPSLFLPVSHPALMLCARAPYDSVSVDHSEAGFSHCSFDIQVFLGQCARLISLTRSCKPLYEYHWYMAWLSRGQKSCHGGACMRIYGVHTADHTDIRPRRMFPPQRPRRVASLPRYPENSNFSAAIWTYQQIQILRMHHSRAFLRRVIADSRAACASCHVPERQPRSPEQSTT
ncbi:hypothetical protein BD413DRAFT_183140 [Trametes elegans]|nr:hypothetical protein BD413DRAFT_183140 [Trametes elegans]